jgi:hypothetical protein
MWEKHQEQITVIDKRIGEHLSQLCKAKESLTIKSKPKPIRHHAPKIEELHDMLIRLYGVNVSNISEINDYTLVRLLGETGTDMSIFPTRKNFVSWCGLAKAS